MLGCVYSHLLSVGKDQRVHSACFRPCHHRVFALTGSEVSLCHWAQTQPQHPEPTGRVEQARSRRQSPREVQGSVSLTSEVWREDWYICFSKRTFKLSEINLEKPFGLPCVCCVSGSIQFSDGTRHGHSAQSPRLQWWASAASVHWRRNLWQCRQAPSLTRFQFLCVKFLFLYFYR